jgi:hypothetical protein
MMLTDSEIQTLARQHGMFGFVGVPNIHDFARDIEQAARRTAPDTEAVIPSDAAIAACALMIRGICMTRPQESWVADIESRIRFMLGVSDPRLAALDRLAENAHELGLGYEPLTKAEPYQWRDTGPLETGDPK